MTTGRVAAALTALCLFCQPTFGFIKVVPEFDDEPGAATFFWAAFTTVGPFIGTTVSAQESGSDEGDKLVQARDDAASFVASDGAIRGAYLQAALRVLRQSPGNASYSDLQLAAALLAWQP
ncbi:DUF2388 domain-containing protein [Pseudomonas paraeruginosa]|uniref:DUF2388 domain-containing protein n=1 Tax=Pseudomonas aeruginosa group TaxID=136841 RepID=UPI00071C1673|nr:MULTISPECIES: DUF2388 domain-containing protein [Pseudomonas aeruginosa group]KSF81570.1 hypothetical protein AO940_05130 [Pseudomonas aeruginosa]PTC33404.1 hypothetical protein CLJ1_6071 [Pseudomonas aeruginosa]